jgi:hypothetical protein
MTRAPKHQAQIDGLVVTGNILHIIIRRMARIHRRTLSSCFEDLLLDISWFAADAAR